MITENRTTLGDERSATVRVVTDYVAVFIRHNNNYVPGLHQPLPFARNVDNG